MKALAYTIGVVLLVTIIGTGLHYFSVAANAANAPAAVADKMINSAVDGSVTSYETFRDQYNVYQERVSQINATKQDLKSIKDPTEAQMTRAELRGQEGSCRDVVAQYNADSSKATKSFFKLGGGSLPNRLDLEACN